MGTKKQHYVPKFYLKNFGNNNKVMVYYKAIGETFTKHINEICVKNHLYENAWKESGSSIGNYVLYNDIENKLCEKEGIFSPIKNMIIALCLDERNRICSVDENEAFKLNVVMMEMNQVKQLISGNKSLLDRLISKR